MIRQILALGGISIAITFGQNPPAQTTGAGTDKLKQLFAYDVTIDPNYKPPKTPWGEPDLQGTWPINHLIAVPLERQRQYGDRLYKTDQEFSGATPRGRAAAAIPVADTRTGPCGKHR